MLIPTHCVDFNTVWRFHHPVSGWWSAIDAAHSWGVFTNHSFDLVEACFCLIHGVGFRRTRFIHGVNFANASFNVVRTSFRLVHGVCFASRHSTSEKHCDTVETSVETSALWAAQRVGFRWQPVWQPNVWQPPELVTFRGNRAGNRRPGSRQPRVIGCEPRCGLAAGAPSAMRTRGAYQPE